MRLRYEFGRIALLAAAFLLLTVPAASGQEVDPNLPKKIVLHPAPLSRPALKYRLTPTFLQQIHGNAAVYLGKVKAEEDAFFGNKELIEKIEKWADPEESTLADLRDPKVIPSIPSNVIDSMRRASRCDACDFQHPLREGNVYAILLPEVQEMRLFARIINADARIHIARGEFAEAVDDLTINYGIGDHFGHGEFLVTDLVGMAIQGMTSEVTLEFIQQPQAPNLYWPLTGLPPIRIRRAMEIEMQGIELQFLDLRGIETAQHPPEEWNFILQRVWREFRDASQDVYGVARKSSMDDLQLIFRVAKNYGLAKQTLISHGRTPAEVEAMPVVQVALLYSCMLYQESADEMFNWSLIPYPQGKAGRRKLDDRLGQLERDGVEIIPFASLLLPAVGAACAAEARQERTTASLRVLEALRLYASEHDGKLPNTLADIKEVPIPLDPTTGEPFKYELTGDVAHLDSAGDVNVPLHYEITMQSP